MDACEDGNRHHPGLIQAEGAVDSGLAHEAATR